MRLFLIYLLIFVVTFGLMSFSKSRVRDEIYNNCLSGNDIVEIRSYQYIKCEAVLPPKK